MTTTGWRLAAALGALVIAGAPGAGRDPHSGPGARRDRPFYEALTAAPGRDAAALVLSATAPDWVSCGGNDLCSPRDKTAAAIAGFGKAVPDLKWEIKEVLVSGDRVVVRGEATGTPAGAFMGVPHGGKSFRIMSIDVHTVVNGKLARSYHIEDWMGAVRQLSAK
ncbi:MAG: ester cyclase [Alphaproteobacteria bacterium]